jgi:hypothetical protein
LPRPSRRNGFWCASASPPGGQRPLVGPWSGIAFLLRDKFSHIRHRHE